MAADDVAFAGILIGSIVLSALLRWLPAHWRADVSAAVGTATMMAACGLKNALHPLSAIALAMVLLKLAPRRWHASAALVTSFGHLAVVRLLPSRPGGPTNAAMLLLTLRLAAPSSELSSAAELMRYASCYHGLFTGPYYSYETWRAAMRAPQPFPNARESCFRLVAAIGALIVWRAIVVALPYRSTWESGGGADTAATWLWRLGYFYVSSFQFRWRFYTCWLMMAASGRFAGFSVADSSNVRVGACELATSPSGLISGWNTSVQAWLKLHVYRSLPPRTPRAVRQLATFVVSAFWHGVHPGYYVCFLGVFAMVCVEQLLRLAWPRGAPVAAAVPRALLRRRQVLSVCRSAICHLWTMGCFTFFGSAFNLLRWKEIAALWRVLRFYGVWLTALPVLPAVLRLTATYFTIRPRHKAE